MLIYMIYRTIIPPDVFHDVYIKMFLHFNRCCATCNDTKLNTFKINFLFLIQIIVYCGLRGVMVRAEDSVLCCAKGLGFNPGAGCAIWCGVRGLSLVTHWPRQHMIGVVWSATSYHRSKKWYQRGQRTICRWITLCANIGSLRVVYSPGSRESTRMNRPNDLGCDCTVGRTGLPEWRL